MKQHTKLAIRVSFLFYLLMAHTAFAKFHDVHKEPAIKVSVDKTSGNYILINHTFGWTFKGSVGASIANVITRQGHDSLGVFKQTSFIWKTDNSYAGAIRWYADKPVVIFSMSVPEKADSIRDQFPSFTDFPAKLNTYSFKDDVFAPHTFNLEHTSTPWLFFNQKEQSFILSPASDFMVSKMMGDSKHRITSGLNPELKAIPAHFTHKTILAFGKHIHTVWHTWGQALQKMYGRKRPQNNEGTILKYYGYWTDNGADYYYNFDKSKGYGGTLNALRERYKQEGIPVGYMQLDSWWYEKSIYDPNGNPTAEYKNHHFSEKGKWNRYGGLLTYRADGQVFPKGLKKFHQKMQLPFVVHNRWIDPHSPYHKKYDITGYAAIDVRFWNQIAKFIHSAGVQTYEQDWLNYIYNKTPHMASDVTVGNAFTDNMARSMEKKGLDMQYCMAMPRYFMQGVKYNNLTTIRTSRDRFEPSKWRNFIYTSQLASSLGIWPWSDVFMSGETGNMIISVLSAGVVGTGDKIGREDKENILEAARTDGVLVKPDAALVPMDQSYLNDSHGDKKPMLAYTYTRQNNIRTDYIFAFAPKDLADTTYSFRPSVLGMEGEVVVYNAVTKKLKKIDSAKIFNDTFSPQANTKGVTRTPSGKIYNYTYYLIAPVTSVGIAFLGDKHKIAATGRQRVFELISNQHKLTAGISFAKGESVIQLHGYYEKPFTVNYGQLSLHPKGHTFELNLSAPANGNRKIIEFSQK